MQHLVCEELPTVVILGEDLSRSDSRLCFPLNVVKYARENLTCCTVARYRVSFTATASSRPNIRDEMSALGL